MTWATVIIFLMGIANFAINRAVFDSGHPLFVRLPQASQTLGSRAALVSEFVVLWVALLLSVRGWPIFAYFYGIYTIANGFAAWLILTRRL
ncbi:hypothetical protein [Erythrobacter donghaensis]|uniref:hypothetical protein n=1 Tax=Erythrobacter donghaensis TaxID=267135 RepID=UPI000A3D21F4|nr:hypothetical protein [Erythrobacter donghaensis]